MESEISKILKGSIDLHVHASPDVQERRMDALETARSAYEYEMGGFVLKSDNYPTAPLAYVLGRMYPGLRVEGSVTLTKSVGGINPDAVFSSGELGAKIVWIPGHTKNEHETHVQNGNPLRIVNSSGDLTSQVLDILDIISRKEMVLAVGNISHKSSLTLVREASSMGISKIMATYQNGPKPRDHYYKLSSLGAYIEFTFSSCMPIPSTISPYQMMTSIREIGVEKSVITTDFGHWQNPPPAEGMRMAISAMVASGMSADEITTLVKENPSQLLS